MFSKKIITVIELSDETKQALAQLDNDMQVLEELTRDVIANQVKVLAALTGEITAQVPVEEVGVEAFDEENDEPPAPVAAEAYQRAYRQSPFNRRPRHEQVAWIETVLKDGRWHTPMLIAKSVSNSSDEFRYLKRSIQGRMREMHEEGLLDRRQSQVRGAFFDYKLKKVK